MEGCVQSLSKMRLFTWKQSLLVMREPSNSCLHPLNKRVFPKYGEQGSGRAGEWKSAQAGVEKKGGHGYWGVTMASLSSALQQAGCHVCHFMGSCRVETVSLCWPISAHQLPNLDHSENWEDFRLSRNREARL